MLPLRSCGRRENATKSIIVPPLVKDVGRCVRQRGSGQWVVACSWWRTYTARVLVLISCSPLRLGLFCRRGGVITQSVLCWRRPTCSWCRCGIRSTFTLHTGGKSLTVSLCTVEDSIVPGSTATNPAADGLSNMLRGPSCDLQLNI